MHNKMSTPVSTHLSVDDLNNILNQLKGYAPEVTKSKFFRTCILIGKKIGVQRLKEAGVFVESNEQAIKKIVMPLCKDNDLAPAKPEKCECITKSYEVDDDDDFYCL